MVYLGFNKFVFVSNYLSCINDSKKEAEEKMEKPELLNLVSLEIKVIFLMDVVAI